MSLRYQSISTYQTKIIVVLSLTLATLFSIIQIYTEFMSLEGDLIDSTNSTIRLVENATTQAAFTYDADLSQEIVEGLLNFPPITSAIILDQDKNVLAEITREKKEEISFFSNYIPISDINKTIELKSQHETVGSIGTFHITVSAQLTKELFISRIGLIILIDFTSAIILGASVWFIYNRLLTNPLLRMADDFSRFDIEHPENDFKHGLETYPNNEIRQVMATGHRLLEALSSNLNRLQVSRDALATANLALSDSEKRYRTFVETSMEGIFCFRFNPPLPIKESKAEQVEWTYQNASIELCNHVFAEDYGFSSPQDVYGKHVIDLQNGDEILARRVIQDWIDQGYRLESYEQKKELPSGEIRYFLINSVSFIENDHVTYLWGSHIDLTERKKTEEALKNYKDNLEIKVEQRTLELQQANKKLQKEISERNYAEIRIRENEAKLSSLINTAAEAIITINQWGTIQSFNPAAERIFGYRSEDSIGANINMLMINDQRKKHDHYLKMHNISGIARMIGQSHEMDAKRSDGAIIPIEFSVSEFRSNGQRMFTGIIHDIAKRKKIEERLRAEERRSRTILTNAGAGVSIVGLEGDFIQINERLCSMLQYSNDELLKLSLYDVTHEHDIKHSQSEIKSLINQEKEKSSIEKRYVRKDKSHFWCETNISLVVDDYGKPDYLIGLSVDISERKEYERNLKKAVTAADQANKAKSEFLSSMSHELRTPLNSIMGFAQILDMDTENPLTEKQISQVKYIIKGGEHLLELIDEVLDLARIEAGKLTLSIESVDLISLLSDCLSFAKTLASKKAIKIIDRVGDQQPDIYVDHLRAKQALLNLLSNAVKYNGPNGTVWLDAECHQQGFLRIRVTDTGIGIAEDKIAEVFQPFNRLGAEATDVEGTGIGLVLTKKLVEEMGGEIGFESLQGQGSSFWIDFPLTKEKSARKTFENSPDEPIIDVTSQSRLLLYVEDNPANLVLMEAIVSAIPNLDMVSAHTAELGLVLAEERWPDVIILDINLPGMDGIEALKHFYALDSSKHIPILALSADAMPSSVQRGLQAGFRDYLTKPINVRKLQTVLKEVLS